MQHLSESTGIIHKAVPQPVPRPRVRPQLRLLPSAPSRAGRAANDIPPELEPPADLSRLYTAPFGFVLHPLVNQRARSVPLVLDQAADLEWVSRALELVAHAGGFDARVHQVAQLEARVRLSGVPSAGEAVARLGERRRDLLQLAASAISPCASGSVPLGLDLLWSGRDELRLRLFCEAGAGGARDSDLHDAARAIAPLLMRVTGVRPSVRACSRPSERARVSCRIGQRPLLASALSRGHFEQAAAAHAIERAVAALASGAHDATIATAHNLVVEQGIAAVALAFGNAPARVCSKLEQHASRFGVTTPLCTWRMSGDAVEGELELPLELAPHGRWGTPDAVQPERDVALLATCIGMAASLVALEDAVRARAHDRQPPPAPALAPADASSASPAPGRP